MDRDARARRILATIEGIPAGQVASYGQVAELAGIPRGARQVGYVLRHADGGDRVPWHRVVRASGQIAFPQGSAGYREQRARLLDEGVAVAAGRIDMRRFRWQPDFDELLWKPQAAWDGE
ncbi:MAG: MGMT family protein [Woeseiaceae bacterium]|nr:MGMT family protein [Woeseiaceae bacterium]